MIIGTFIHDKETDSFSGDISTLHFQFSPVEIMPVKKNGENGPDYRLISETAHGHVELGAAWKRTSEQGRDFISVSLDAPLLDAPLNAALFMADSGVKASMVWNRRKPAAETSTEASEAPAKAPKPRAKAKAA
ncbi:MAG TPA: DUF736 domain-containing protein [Bryobacteraceae bacterium]|jgi:uncharacterized protein (DUF736 family)